MNGAVRDLQILFEVGNLGGLSDGQLLERFVARREEAVFEAIVRRYGPVVWGVCARVLRDHHDAEDAFQTTFLVLERKAASVMIRDKLGGWLYGVAYQTARKARAMRSKRRAREVHVPDMPEPEAKARGDHDGLVEWLDPELSRLPERYRTPIILCALEGRSHKEAAGALGWPIGTVSSRLSRAKAMLARRLARRGVALSAGGLAALLARETTAATMPAGLVGPTVRAASLFATGRLSVGVAALRREVLKAMFLSKLKVAATTLVAAVAVVAGGVGLASRAEADGPETHQKKGRLQPSNEQEKQPGTAVKAKLDPSLRTPRVASASPDDGAADVDPATRALRVTFDQDMERGMSVATSGGGPTDPLDPAADAQWSDARTIVVPLKLKPSQDYELSINTERFRNFTNVTGKPAVPYPIRFRTGDGKAKKAAAKAKAPERTPRVASASPDDGEVDVDPGTRELRVKFDQDMSQGSMSILGSGPTFPAETKARPRWTDARTLVLPLKLEPGRDYELSFNGGRFQGFRNTGGQPAVPYPIHFRTGKAKNAPAKGAAAKAGPAAAPPHVASASPDDGAMDVDPATRELRVTFDQDMDRGGFSIVGGGPTFPADPSARPRWADARTVVLPLKLEPNRDYQLCINSARFQNFKSADGQPAEPYPIRFRTGTSKREKVPKGAAKKLTERENREAIARLKTAIDEDYSYRDLHEFDWNAAFASAADRLAAAETPLEFAKSAAALFAPAQDMHLTLTVGDWKLPSYDRKVTANLSWPALERAMPGLDVNGPVAVGRLGDGVTYILIASWAADTVLDAAYQALGETDERKGLIVDVRPNGGGSEPLAQAFAGCFLDETHVYAKHVTRRAGGFSQVRERSVGPNRHGPRYRGKVAVLMGPATMSSCESFLLMMKQVPGCTLVGARSYGSSGNPQPVDLGNGVTALVPSWKDLRLDGSCFEGEGLAPDVEVRTSPSDFANGDPVLEAAWAVLAKK